MDILPNIWTAHLRTLKVIKNIRGLRNWLNQEEPRGHDTAMSCEVLDGILEQGKDFR